MAWIHLKYLVGSRVLLSIRPKFREICPCSFAFFPVAGRWMLSTYEARQQETASSLSWIKLKAHQAGGHTPATPSTHPPTHRRIRSCTVRLSQKTKCSPNWQTHKTLVGGSCTCSSYFGGSTSCWVPDTLPSPTQTTSFLSFPLSLYIHAKSIFLLFWYCLQFFIILKEKTETTGLHYDLR